MRAFLRILISRSQFLTVKPAVFRSALSYQFHTRFHTPGSYPCFIPQFYTPGFIPQLHALVPYLGFILCFRSLVSDFGLHSISGPVGAKIPSFFLASLYRCCLEATRAAKSGPRRCTSAVVLLRGHLPSRALKTQVNRHSQTRTMNFSNSL